MSTPEQEELNARTYTALGRYVVAFSALLRSLETSTVQLLVPEPDGRKMMLLGAALSDRTASPIVAAFFSVFYKCWDGQMSDEDLIVMRCLRRELDYVVKQRNRLMHDAWMSRTVGGHPGPHAMARHRVRAHGAGVDFESEIYPPEKLEEIAEDLTRLSSVVNGTVWYSRPGQCGPELSKRFRVVDKKVQRMD